LGEYVKNGALQRLQVVEAVDPLIERVDALLQRLGELASSCKGVVIRRTPQ
jgi:hypothetical protein